MSNIALALNGGGVADSHDPNNGGRLSYSGGNEDACDSYVADAPLRRVGSTIQPDGGGGGGLAFDDLPNGPSGRRVQIALVHVEQSEQARGQIGNRLGSFNLFLNDGNGEADANMVRVLRIDPQTGTDPRNGAVIEAFWMHEHVWESFVRQIIPRLSGQSASAPSRLYSGNGRWCWNYQDDGNFVQYCTRNNPDETTWTAVYDSADGDLVPRDQWSTL